jgi:hypothetical protein
VNISIDFDDTYTRDPEMWNAFIRLAQASGHKVYCVTARSWREDEQVLGSVGQVVGRENCYFTALQGKKAFMAASGIIIHVWIDDMPHMIVDGIETVNDGKIFLDR